MVDKTVEYRNSYRNDSYNRSRNRSRERSFSRNMATLELGVQAIVGPGQDLEQVQIETEFGGYKCREYNHFARDCTTSREEKEIEQLQQMLNLGEEQASLTSNMQENFGRTGSEENLRTGHLNL